jgi:SAM-dependent methyltransferase
LARESPDIRSYWDKKIVEWEDSMQPDARVSPVERLAARFRRPVRNRADAVMDLLTGRVAGKSVLELGCGSGFFALRLYRTAQPAQVTGIDFSSAAISRANEIAKREGLAHAVSFSVGDVSQATLPDTDFTIGLGLLDYLDRAEIRELFERIRSPNILFTFSRSDVSLLRFAHVLYLATQRCPKHFYYSEATLESLIGTRFGDLTFIADRRRMSFGGIVHSLEADGT